MFFLNKKLFSFGFEASSLCLLCNFEDETPLQILFDCYVGKSLWSQLQKHFSDDFRIHTLTP